MPKTTVFQGCENSDGAVVTWQAEEPNQLDSYQVENPPIRVILDGALPQAPCAVYTARIFYTQRVVYAVYRGISEFAEFLDDDLESEIDLPGVIGVPVFSRVSTGDGRGNYQAAIPCGEPVYSFAVNPETGIEEEIMTCSSIVYNCVYNGFYPVTIAGAVYEYGTVSSPSMKVFDDSGREVSIGVGPDDPAGWALIVETFIGEPNNAGQFSDDDYWTEVFRLNFTNQPQNVAVDCDCEIHCVKVFRRDKQQFYCICKDEEDEDLAANKERIKQEVIAEIFPLLKEQIKQEVKAELTTQITNNLQNDSDFKDGIKQSLIADTAFIETLGTSLSANAEFKTALKLALATDAEFITAINTGLIANEAFKTALKTEVDKVVKQSVEELKEELDLKAPDGLTYDTVTAGAYILRIKLTSAVPVQVSITRTEPLPATANQEIQQALYTKYNQAFMIGTWQQQAGKLVATLS